MFDLIFTTFFDGYSGYVVRSTVVSGFKTEQACRYAGAQQELALRQDFNIKTDKKYTFICVKKD